MPAVHLVKLQAGPCQEYAEQGDPDGLPVLLLHGFADSRRSWEPVMRHLPQQMRVLALSLRGHGDSSKPTDGYDIPQLAADVRAWMGVLNLHRAVIVGHSMGSAIAQRLAIDHPGLVRGLVLVGASGGISAAPRARAYWDPLLAQMADPVDESLVRGMVDDAFEQPPDHEFRDMLVRESLKVPARVWKDVFASRWRGLGDPAGQLGTIRAPTMLVAGHEDRRYPPEAQALLAAEIPGARLILYPGCGHCPHWEQPQHFAADLAVFVSSLITTNPSN